MALTAKGFGLGNEQIDGLAWSYLADGLGCDSDFASPGAYAPTIGSGLREVVVAAGRATAWGVDVVSDAPASIFLDEAVGTARAWAICLRRDWTSAPGAASLVKLDCGGSSPVRPGTARTRRTGGAIDDQLICYAVVSPGVSTVLIIDGRVFADKVRCAMSAEANAWDPQPGRLTRTPDGSWYSQAPTAGGQIVNVSAFKRMLSIERTDIVKQAIGANGSLRLAWYESGQDIGFTPRIVNAWCHIAGVTSSPVLLFPDINQPPTQVYGWFFVRNVNGTVFVPAASLGPNDVVISRITATVTEA